jgi:hypothetical protein
VRTAQTAVRTVHSTVRTVRSGFCTVPSAVGSVHSAFRNVRKAVRSVHSALRTVRSAVAPVRTGSAEKPQAGGLPRTGRQIRCDRHSLRSLPLVSPPRRTSARLPRPAAPKEARANPSWRAWREENSKNQITRTKQITN